MKTENLQKIYESSNSTLHKGKHPDFDNEIVIKVLSAEYPTDEQIKRFNREYEFTKDIESKGIRKVLKTVKESGKNILILEWFDGKTLSDFVSETSPDIETLLKIAINIATTIIEIHKKNIIHKDINSNNILVNSRNETKIIDFGLASKYSLKTQDMSNPSHLEGTLTYISPEQTGRMNRTLDYRTDFYSLGVTFYRMFTGKLPFEYEDSMKLVHAHIAELPKPPDLININIPKVLSDIILKLLAKNAEDRYQSGFGLKHDLEKIVSYEVQIPNFKLGEKDFSGQLIIPEKLYGRENEREKLLEIYERINNLASKELLLISGYSGTGKSVLIHEIHKPVAQRQGIYIEGKFDQFQKDVPYYGLIQAFSDFASILINETDEKLLYWKNLIQKSVGNIGKVLTNLIPDFELIIGEQAEIPELDGEQARNRFNFLWQNFIKAVCNKKHPLVLFIDDMQWVDNASIELLKNLLADLEIKYFMCIAAYRENETNDNHQFIGLIDSLKEQELTISNINIGNLQIEDVNNFVSDTLNAPDNFQNLASLIYEKTHGNAFFTIQFIKTLYENELLKYNFEEGAWRYEINKIETQKITNNVVELLTNKILKLSPKTLELLKIAACIGNRFDKSIISAIADDVDNLDLLLEPAIFDGIIIPYKKNTYRFIHDRLQQAVYTLISSPQRNNFHLQIGRLLLQKYQNDEAKLSKYIFDIVNQINYGLELVTDKAEKKQLIELNIEAGKKAKKSTAYMPALNYYINAENILSDNLWLTNYKKTLSINEDIADLYYLTGQHNKAKEKVNYILQNTKNVLDKINSYCTLINSYNSQAKFNELIDIGLKVLTQLEFNVNQNPKKSHIIVSFIKTQIVIGKKNMDDLAKLPLMSDKQKLASLKIVAAIGTPLFFENPELFLMLMLKILRTIIKQGNSVYSPFFYSTYGLILSAMNYIDKALIFSKTAKKLIPVLKAEQYSAKIHHLLQCSVLVWKNKLHETTTAIFETYKIASEIGDLEYAALGLCSYLYYKCYENKALHQIQKKAIQNIIILDKLNQHNYTIVNNLIIQLCENFISINDNPTKIKGDYFDEDVKHKNTAQLATVLYLKLNLQLIYCDFSESERCISKLEKNKSALQAIYDYALSNFYISLASLQIYSKNNDKQFLIKAIKNQKIMHSWAKHCPRTFQHKFDLVQAEIMRVQNKSKQARDLYDKAIKGAKSEEFSMDEAMSWQFAARFYLNSNNEEVANIYMQKAYSCYRKWGAAGVCSYLEQNNQRIDFTGTKIFGNSETIIPSIFSSNISTTSSSVMLDMSSIIKASQAFSGEVKLDKLLKDVMRIIIENAGAEYCLIINNDEEKYTIEGESNLKNNVEKVLQNESILNTNKLPLSVLKYVIRTKKPIALNNAIKHSTYSKDNYIISNEIKSLLCYPIVHKNKLLSILYLENNISNGTFTMARIETINMLSSQIAISIENALLYDNLEQKVETRTFEVNAQKKEIEDQRDEIIIQKNLIEKSHTNITASINYAKRIQDAILPSSELFKENFKEYFILFKPRDVVSGDFYWAKKIDNYVVFIVADCTGHGVPGAFVSMLGISFLNEIVQIDLIWQSECKASQMLELLRNIVKDAFHKKGGIAERKDGMDLALCILNTTTNELHYSGANNPLCIVRKKSLSGFNIENVKVDEKDDFEITQIKPDAMPIGIFARERLFTNHKIQLESNDKLYIFSDGFIDQMGGKYGKKFMIRQFRKLLLEIHAKPMTEQKQLLEETLKNWMSDKYKQIDDILVMGVEI